MGCGFFDASEVSCEAGLIDGHRARQQRCPGTAGRTHAALRGVPAAMGRLVVVGIREHRGHSVVMVVMAGGSYRLLGGSRMPMRCSFDRLIGSVHRPARDHACGRQSLQRKSGDKKPDDEEQSPAVHGRQFSDAQGAALKEALRQPA